jgi:hypothetical protein
MAFALLHRTSKTARTCSPSRASLRCSPSPVYEQRWVSFHYKVKDTLQTRTTTDSLEQVFVERVHCGRVCFDKIFELQHKARGPRSAWTLRSFARFPWPQVPVLWSLRCNFFFTPFSQHYHGLIGGVRLGSWCMHCGPTSPSGMSLGSHQFKNPFLGYTSRI